MSELFREEALKKRETLEQSDKQIKIIRPSMWLVCIILIISVLTIGIWSVTYHITDGVEVQGIVFTNHDAVLMRSSRNCILQDVLVEEGEYVEVGDLLAIASDEDKLQEIEQLRTQLDGMDPSGTEYAAQEQLIQKAVESYASAALIKSDTTGYIQSIAGRGNALSEGDTIVSIMPGSGYREVIAYVSLQTAQNLRQGMKTQISPVYASREEYGYMTGVITSISDFPVTRETAQEKMGTVSYIDDIFPGSSAVEVHIRLELDSESGNGYLWSNPKGEELTVEFGAQCSIEVITDEYRPIELIVR